MHMPLMTRHTITDYWINEIRAQQTRNIYIPYLITCNCWKLSEATFSPKSITFKNSDNTNTSVTNISQIFTLFSSDIQYSHVLLEGEAGSGKTTLLQYLLCSQDKTQHQFDLIIDISLNKLSFIVNNSTELTDVLQWRYGLPPIDNQNDKEKVEQLLSSVKILWLLDGLDEVSDKLTESHSALFEFFYNCLVQQPYVLVSTRKGHRTLFNANHIIKLNGLYLDTLEKTWLTKTIHYQLLCELNHDPNISNENTLWPSVIDKIIILHWPAISQTLIQHYSCVSKESLKNGFYTAVYCAAFLGLLYGQKESITITTCQEAYKCFITHMEEHDIKNHITFEKWLIILIQCGFIHLSSEAYCSFKHILFQEQLAARYLGQLLMA